MEKTGDREFIKEIHTVGLIEQLSVGLRSFGMMEKN
jgi:hypothetical protein